MYRFPLEGSAQRSGPPTPRPPQGQQIPGAPGMIVVVLEPGTDLELRLGDEVLVLAPQAALQLTLPDLLVVVVPAQLLRSPEGLCFPAHARWLHPADPDATWQIHLGDGCVAARSTGRQRTPRAPRDPRCSPPCPRTLLLKPLCRAAGPRRASPVHGPCLGRRPLPADFSLDLGGPGPWPSSALRPLPPSPSPGPRLCHAARRRPPCKARRRLF